MRKRLSLLVVLAVGWNLLSARVFAQDLKAPNVAGTFYPENPRELSILADNLLDTANPEKISSKTFGLICPHAGYGFSGPTASFAYKLIKGKNYKTVIIIGPSHNYGFIGISVYRKGAFKTPLGVLEIDSEFTQKLLDKDKEIISEPLAFEKEHSIEVHLPFLQRALSGFKIAPVITGDCTLSTCEKFAALLKEAIGGRSDILVIASTDMYHGFNYQEAEIIDTMTLSYLKNMDAQGLYFGLRENKLQLCGGFGVVSLLFLAKSLGYNKLNVLNYTTSAQVTGKRVKGVWTVGYASSVIFSESASSAKGE